MENGSQLRSLRGNFAISKRSTSSKFYTMITAQQKHGYDKPPSATEHINIPTLSGLADCVTISYERSTFITKNKLQHTLPQAAVFDRSDQL
jgi:hypothetical protein